MPKFLMVFKRWNWFFIVGLILSLTVLWPLLAAPYFTMHDDIHIVRLDQMNECVKDMQIPCRWVPDMGGEYGYPLFNYYAPLPYYVGEIFLLITGNLIISAKAIFGLSLIGSFVFIYLLGKKLWGSAGGALSGVFYSFAPYHAIDFYVRGAVEEMWALMFFPAIFWAILRLKEKPNIANSLLLGAFVSGLILSHNLSAMIFLPILISFSAILFFLEKKRRFLTMLAAAIILGLSLAAFYFLPVIFEKNLVHVETTTAGYFSYTEHFKGLKKLILDRSWGYGASVREVPGGPKDGMSFQIGWVHLFGFVLSLLALWKLGNKDRSKSLIILFSAAAIFGAIFMIHPRSEFVWKLIDPLKYLQFPWRFLMIIIFFISLPVGSIVFVTKGKMRWILLAVLAALVVGLNFSYFRPAKFRYVTDSILLSGKQWDIGIKRSIFDFLPIYAKAPPAELATAKYQIISGSVQISHFQKGSDWITFQADSKTPSVIRLSQYYFPNWEVRDNGQKIPIDHKNDLGLITIGLNPGLHNIQARLFDTPIRTLANIITAAAILVCLVLPAVNLIKVRAKKIRQTEAV